MVDYSLYRTTQREPERDLVMKSSIIPIEDNKKTVSAIARERIRSAILSGELPAGSRLDQAQLAVDLQVSLAPIREALKTLDAEGFVKIIPRRGAFVAHTSTKDMDDLYFTRQILEGRASYHAATRLTDEDITTLEWLFNDMNHQLETHSFIAFMASNREFHFTIYKALDNEVLINMIASSWDLSDRYRYQYLLIRDQGVTIQKEHQVILEACRERNAQKLESAIIIHMQRTLESLKSYFQTHREEVKEES